MGGLKVNNYTTRNKRSVWKTDCVYEMLPWLLENHPNVFKEYFGKNTDVWEMSTARFKGSHYAVFPPELPRTCIKAGCPERGVVLDPFNGSGTSGIEAYGLNREYIGIDLNSKDLDMTIDRAEPILNQMRF